MSVTDVLRSSPASDGSNVRLSAACFAMVETISLSGVFVTASETGVFKAGVLAVESAVSGMNDARAAGAEHRG